MIASIPAILLLFTIFSPQRAVLVGMLGAWLFLPMASFHISGLPDINKMSIACGSVLAGCLLVDTQRFLTLRISVADVFMTALILVQIPSSIGGGFGWYEGVAFLVDKSIAWGMPYLIGRLYFADAAGLEELAKGIFYGGLVYTPLVLYEAKQSPNLHYMVYGFHQHDFGQTMRMGGWRPMVFMQHGLALAVFMGTAAICGLWLARNRILRPIYGVPAMAVAIALLMVALACRSTYAAMLTVAGVGVLWASRAMRTTVLVLALLLIPPAYMTARTVGGWDASSLVELASSLGEDRLGSFGVRIASENAMWKWVNQRSVLLGSGRLEIGLLGDGDYLIPDGLWIIILGTNGLVGLVALYGVLLVPSGLFLLRNSGEVFLRPDGAGAAALVVVVAIYAMDTLQNAMINPIYMLAAGGLAVVKLSPNFVRPVLPGAK